MVVPCHLYHREVVEGAVYPRAKGEVVELYRQEAVVVEEDLYVLEVGVALVDLFLLEMEAEVVHFFPQLE